VPTLGHRQTFCGFFREGKGLKALPLRPAASAEQIQLGAEVLRHARRLLIIAGGGVIASKASVALQTLAEYLHAPVLTTAEGKGALSDRHPLALGAMRLRQDPIVEYLAQTDVVLVVGTRLAFGATVSAQGRQALPRLFSGQTVVQIDVDASEVGRNYANTVGLVGDATRTLEALYATLVATTPAWPSRQEEIAALKRARRESPHANLQPLAGFLTAIRNAMPDDGIVIAGMTQIGYYSRSYYPVYQPGTFLTSSYFGNLGYAFPTARGAKVARPDAAVVAISGDGGFLCNSQELATAVAHKINAVVIVFNNNAFGNVMRDQRDRFQGRVYGAELHNPDCMKLVDAYGARGARAHTAEELEAKLKEALGLNAPTLIEVPCGPIPYPY
jgi:acetolactate synthase-1/2/3 large subunit